MDIKPILTEAQLQSIKATVERVVADYIKKMPWTLRKELTNHVMLAIGFRPGFGGRGYEVDHGGQNASIIANFISSSAKREAEIVLSDLVKQWVLELHKPGSSFTTSIKNEFVDNYTRQLRHLLHQQAQALAERDAKTIAEALAQLRLELPLVRTELEHPDGYDGKIGKAMLWRMLEDGTIQVGGVVSDTSPVENPDD